MRLSVYRDVYHPTIALLIGQRSVESARWPIYGQIDSNTNEHFSKREKLDETHSKSGAWAQDLHTTVASEARITSFLDGLSSIEEFYTTYLPNQAFLRQCSASRSKTQLHVKHEAQTVIM